VTKLKTDAKITMPVKAIPYRHQVEAFNLICEKFGLCAEVGDD
jgi:hypothetical protein